MSDVGSFGLIFRGGASNYTAPVLGAMVVLEAAHRHANACPHTCMRAFRCGLAVGLLFMLYRALGCDVRMSDDHAHYSYRWCSLRVHV